jgi:hypothetical protein
MTLENQIGVGNRLPAVFVVARVLAAVNLRYFR